MTLTYDAVGATRDPNLVRDPPRGFRPLEREVRLGSGSELFGEASAAVLDWQLQLRSGFRVERAASGPLRSGDRVRLIIPFGPLGIPAPAEVVYLVDEPRRRGFAYGTLPGHPESGEEAFLIEHRDDDSVWLVIRAFSRPSRWLWSAVSPVLRVAQEFYTRRYLRSLAPR